jgi:hypothetical protein
MSDRDVPADAHTARTAAEAADAEGVAADTAPVVADAVPHSAAVELAGFLDLSREPCGTSGVSREVEVVGTHQSAAIKLRQANADAIRILRRVKFAHHLLASRSRRSDSCLALIKSRSSVVRSAMLISSPHR